MILKLKKLKYIIKNVTLLTGSISLLSHLDIIRLLERALRRSNLPVSYSNGFHPLPRLQIALALPLGVEEFGEWMDIDFTEKMQPESMRNTLQSALPQELKQIKAEQITNTF